MRRVSAFAKQRAANTPNSTRARPNHVKAYEKRLFGNVRTVVPRFGQNVSVRRANRRRPWLAG